MQQEDRSQGEEISRKTFSFYFMEITRLVLGPLATNTYCLKIDNSVIIIDPAGRLDKMLPYLDQCDFLAILLTHGQKWTDILLTAKERLLEQKKQ